MAAAEPAQLAEPAQRRLAEQVVQELTSAHSSEDRPFTKEQEAVARALLVRGALVVQVLAVPEHRLTQLVAQQQRILDRVAAVAQLAAMVAAASYT